MITLFYIRINLCILQFLFEWFGDIDIIYPPSFILKTHSWEALTPPTVSMWFGMKFSKTINPTAIKEFIHPCSFFRKKTRRFFISFWIVNIDLLVSNIIITTKNKIGMFI